MGPPREEHKAQAGKQEKSSMPARPPAEARNTPEFYRCYRHYHQSEPGQPPEHVSSVKPWVNVVAYKSNILIGHTEGQNDQRQQQNLEQANNPSADVEEPVAPIGEQRSAVAFPNQ